MGERIIYNLSFAIGQRESLLFGVSAHYPNSLKTVSLILAVFFLVIKQWKIEPDTLKRGIVDHYHAGRFQPIDADEGKIKLALPLLPKARTPSA